ncbi:hypothetical protein E2320_000140 [Naja naja]|nr:hypothetical protein E2320_000140 [Naja naja]
MIKALAQSKLRFATMRKLSRDVLVYSVRRTTRDCVQDCHFKTKLRMENVDIIVLKEISVRILRKRKTYSFLTDILKTRQITFCWDKLEGVILTHHEQRFRLNSIDKAKDFFVQT